MKMADLLYNGRKLVMFVLERPLLLVILVAITYALLVAAVVDQWHTAQRESFPPFSPGTMLAVPRYTTELLPMCNRGSQGMLAFDSTISTFKVCNGMRWTIMETR